MIVSNNEVFVINLPMVLDTVVIPSDDNHSWMASTRGGVKPWVSSIAIKAPYFFLSRRVAFFKSTVCCFSGCKIMLCALYTLMSC